MSRTTAELLFVILGAFYALICADEAMPLLVGTHLVINNDVEVVYQLPQSTQKPIAGIVFLAHGCSHSATDWWPHNPVLCTACIGLPVEKAVVSAALSHGYLAVAQSSLNRRRKCWDEVDIARAVSTIQYLIANHSLPTNIPIHLFGASSGGGFVGRLAMKALHEGTIPIKIASAIIQIMPIHIEIPLPSSRIPGLLFMHMVRDSYSAESISGAVKEANSPLIQEILLQPLKVTPSFFYDHMKHLNLQDSQNFVAALSKAGYLNSDNLLLEDPRMSSWREIARQALPGIVPLYDSLVPDTSGISELLNLAYCMHEMSDFALDQVFDFMKKMEI